MQASMMLRATVAIVLAAASTVAALAADFLLRSTMGAPAAGQAASGALLGAAVYAPFALVALLLPALAVPMARAILATARGGRPSAPVQVSWPLAVEALVLWACTEALLGVAMLLAEPEGQAPLGLHAMLAGYAIIAAWSLTRKSGHDDSFPPAATS